MVMYEVLLGGETTFQDSSKYFQAFRFNQTMKHSWHVDRLQIFGSLGYILCFIIYISLHHNRKYTPGEVTTFHYYFLSSKTYQDIR